MRRQREDLVPRLGNRDRVLELGRERAVARDGGPAIAEYLHMRTAEIDHRLDGEEHPGLQRHAFAAAAVMQDVGLVVEQPAKAVAAEVAHDGAALGLGEGLDGSADVAGRGARA